MNSASLTLDATGLIMHPGEIAAATPDKAAYIMAETGQTITYAERERTSNAGAHLFRSLGLQRGDHIAILLENHPRFFQLCWAAQRSGLYYTAISWRLQADEVEYIVRNCEARVFVTSKAREAVAAPLLERVDTVAHWYMLDDVAPGFASWEEAIAAQPDTPIADEAEGASMLYLLGYHRLP